MRFNLRARICLGVLAALSARHYLEERIEAAPPAVDFRPLAERFVRDIRPRLQQHCRECHSADRSEAEIDFSQFANLDSVRQQPRVWQQTAEMLSSRQMPPRDARPLPDPDREQILSWLREYLLLEAKLRDGDPGPVVLRRLSNAEYTYTLRDLTGLENLNPAQEFPADSAAGEGFTNVGQALPMSPAMLTKYLDAAKEVAAHAVLLPNGLRFSPTTTRRDWSNEALAQIRNFYTQFSAPGGGVPVNLQGIQFDTNQGGRLPVAEYLGALVTARADLRTGKTSLATVAKTHQLSLKYLTTLWEALNGSDDSATSALPLPELRRQWNSAPPQDVPHLAKYVAAWQAVLWKFHSIGHVGRAGGPQVWQEAVTPIVPRATVRWKIPESTSPGDRRLSLLVRASDEQPAPAAAIWERPRLVTPGRPDLLLRDVAAEAQRLTERRERVLRQSRACLAAAAEAEQLPRPLNISALAAKHSVDQDALAAWFEYLGLHSAAQPTIGKLIQTKSAQVGAYDFVRGWVGDEALSVLANSSDQSVRIPGTMPPHSVGVHPTPTLNVTINWKSPVAGRFRISGQVVHAHPECGNGVTWSLERRSGAARWVLASGVSQRATPVKLELEQPLPVRVGDVVTLAIGPRDGNHSCDLTNVELIVRDDQREWHLSQDVTPDILAGNPHADRLGNRDVWHFAAEAAGAGAGTAIPAGSLLARWQSASPEQRPQLAEQIQSLVLSTSAPATSPSSTRNPDAELWQQLTSLRGPLVSAAATGEFRLPTSPPPTQIHYGLAAAKFGQVPGGPATDPASLCVSAPSRIEFLIPADLVAGSEFVADGVLTAASGHEPVVQFQVTDAPSADLRFTPEVPFVAAAETPAGQRLRQELERFRQLFPVALCYTRIVPVDEVVTLTLYYREDGHLVRLMLSDEQARELDRLWDELLYIAQEPLESVVAFEQISEFATQDRPDLVKSFAPLRKPILERAEAFRRRLVASEPAHVDALVRFAQDAFRRPLHEPEASQLRNLYARLRKEELPHDEAIRMLLVRILASPEFLYKLEQPGEGSGATPVTDWELANRLSYFFWSSPPDAELRRLAAAGRLREPEVLRQQARRLRQDPRVRRLSTEFLARWLQLNEVAHSEEKSERHFPTFAPLRGAMLEESLLTFTDLFQNDRSVLSLVSADHTYLNEDLAGHYGIPGVAGSQWRRVDGVEKYARGGVLAQAAFLSQQSGASRTSPILRGNWLSEVLLGEKLPRPPKNVPQLSDTVPAGLTERQLIERHSSDAACSHCHLRIDPLGFALEQFDAIGRFRERDAAGQPIDARTQLPDGTRLDGLRSLQEYVRTTRREAFVRQFCRKLLGYSLGRSVQLSDEPLLARMQQALAAHDYRVSAALDTVVTSDPFWKIRGLQWDESAE